MVVVAVAMALSTRSFDPLVQGWGCSQSRLYVTASTAGVVWFRTSRE